MTSVSFFARLELMRLDVPRPDAWDHLSEQYRAALSLKEPALNIQIYAGVGHAVSEIAKAIARLFTHKKTIAVISGVDPAFNSVAVEFSQEGFIVKSITPAESAKAETWAPLMDELLFVLTCDDDPITGRRYPFESSTFVGKRVFRLHVSHEAHRWEAPKRPDPFVAQIWSLAPDRALMVAGERCKLEPQLAPTLFWKSETDVNITESLNAHSVEELTKIRASVLEFEADLPAGFCAYFKPGEQRIFDRTVLYHSDFDGSAVIDELSSTLQIPLNRPGEDSSLESTSACRWESPRFNDWLLSRGETDATTRGLVIVDGDLIHKGLRTHLETAAAKLARLQNG